MSILIESYLGFKHVICLAPGDQNGDTVIGSSEISIMGIYLILNFHLAVLSIYYNALCFIQANLTYFELAKKYIETNPQNKENPRKYE